MDKIRHLGSKTRYFTEMDKIRYFRGKIRHLTFQPKKRVLVKKNLQGHTTCLFWFSNVMK